MKQHDLLGQPWLPRGAHWDLNIQHDPQRTLGRFPDTGGWKLIHHTAESKRDTASIIAEVVKGKRAIPHLVFGYDPHTAFPVVIQLAPLTDGVMTLEHNFPEETNRARCIQIEICGRAQDSHRWSDNYYKGYANLCRMIERRVAIPRRAPLDFPDRKCTPAGFVRASGHLGHVHVPGNSHTDPGDFQIHKLFRFMEAAANHGNALKRVPR